MAAEQPITPFDWQRLLIGEDPFGFYFEIIFRSFVMYVILLILLRTLSKRALTQLSILEFGIVIALGSAAGDPTFYKDIPLFQGILVLVTVITVQMIYTWLVNKNEAFENAMEGLPVELIDNGCILKGSLDKARISQSELFELLRTKGIQQLGQLRKAYMEQNGQLSLFLFDEPQPGLAIVPPWELEEPKAFKSGAHLEKLQTMACRGCGAVSELPQGMIPGCHCGEKAFHQINMDPLGIGENPQNQ